jgi:hypothetical protein
VLVADSYTTLYTALTDIAWSDGDRITVVCPAIAEELRGREVAGTDVYTHPTFLCLSAVHAGVTGMDDGGVVVAELIEWFDHPSVEAVERNGVRATTWGRFEAGYRFVGDP